jgi:hypothetical protein
VPQRKAPDAGHTLKAATGCTRRGQTDWSSNLGLSEGILTVCAGKDQVPRMGLEPAQDASFWGLAHVSVGSQRADMREQLANSLRFRGQGFKPPGLQEGKVGVDENTLERLFTVEPVEDPPCEQGQPALAAGWLELVSEIERCAVCFEVVAIRLAPDPRGRASEMPPLK